MILLERRSHWIDGHGAYGVNYPPANDEVSTNIQIANEVPGRGLSGHGERSSTRRVMRHLLTSAGRLPQAH